MPRSNDIWILTADRRRARIFAAERPRSSELTEVEAFVQPDASLPDRERVEPPPGRQHNGGNVATRHGVDSRSSEREKSTTKFVRDIVNRLEKAHHKGEFSKLVLVASPDVLGSIRAQLSNDLKQDVTFELDKELTTLRPHELRNHLPQALAPSLKL